MRDRLEIRKRQLPYRVSVPLGSKVFEFEFHYNAAGDFYTVHLYSGGALLCAGEKLVLGRALFEDCYEAGVYPTLRLAPHDEAETAHRCGKNELGISVFLTLDDEERGG